MPSHVEMGGLTPEMAAFMNAIQSRLDQQDTRIATQDAKIATQDAKIEEQGATIKQHEKEFKKMKRNARFRSLCTSLKHALRCWENHLHHCYIKALHELRNTTLANVSYYMFVSILRHQKQNQKMVQKPLKDFASRILQNMIRTYNSYNPKEPVVGYILEWIIIDVIDVRFKLNDEHHDVLEMYLVDEGFGSLLDQIFQVDQEMVLDKGLFILDKTHNSSKKLNDSVNIFVSNRCTIPANLAWNDIKQFQVRVAALGRFLDHLSNPGGTPRIPYQAVKDNVKAEKPPKINFNIQYTGVVDSFKKRKLIK